jgi:hypothetical protein
VDEVTPAALKRAAKARARIRQHVWDLLPAVPASKVAGTDLGGVVVLDADATLVTAHSEKDQARATFKGGYGFRPIGVWCDNTHEMLAITLRPGNAGSNHAGDHIEVLTRAIAQLPGEYRRNLLIRLDGAGATHELLDWLTAFGQVRGRQVEYSVGFPTKNNAVTSAMVARGSAHQTRDDSHVHQDRGRRVSRAHRRTNAPGRRCSVAAHDLGAASWSSSAMSRRGRFPHDHDLHPGHGQARAPAWRQASVSGMTCSPTVADDSPPR